ncbi:uncharacterized protein JCM6883_004329 [Sporobolomyces salmoneus]|uniref:uncharacterized protein n=1 Tax=Sporobolomyces salmoneus TaxID=183962 RepID=UPI00317162F2
MLTHAGWSVQLYLGSTKLSAFNLEAIGSTIFASYSAPSSLLAIGSEWTLIWRDDRPGTKHELYEGGGETVVGLVSEAEGAGARDAQTSLVGTSLSPPLNEQSLPFVKGIIRMGISPLKIQLVLKQGQTTPVPIHSNRSPLATFELLVYPDYGHVTPSPGVGADDRDQAGTVNSGISNPSSSSRLATRPTPSSSASASSVYQSTPSHHSHTSTTQQIAHQFELQQRKQTEEISNLERALESARDQSTYFEKQVSKVYSFLSPSQQILYCSNRLEPHSPLSFHSHTQQQGSGQGKAEEGEREILSPELRISISISREMARRKREEIEEELVEREVERMIKVLKETGTGAHEEEEKEEGGEKDG